MLETQFELCNPPPPVVLRLREREMRANHGAPLFDGGDLIDSSSAAAPATKTEPPLYSLESLKDHLVIDLWAVHLNSQTIQKA